LTVSQRILEETVAQTYVRAQSCANEVLKISVPSFDVKGDEQAWGRMNVRPPVGIGRHVFPVQEQKSMNCISTDFYSKQAYARIRTYKG
jgi:hypothetical protein